MAEESEGEEDDKEDGAPPVASPTLSDMLCESLAVGYSEEEVAALVDAVVASDDPAREGLQPSDQLEVLRRIVHRRTAPSVIRPWRGPLPKVRLPSLTLLDFMGPDSWKVVSRRRKKGRLAAAPAPVPARSSGAIGAARSARLKERTARAGWAGTRAGPVGPWSVWARACRTGNQASGLRG